MSLLHMSVTQQKSLINSILPRQRLASVSRLPLTTLETIKTTFDPI